MAYTLFGANGQRVELQNMPEGIWTTGMTVRVTAQKVAQASSSVPGSYSKAHVQHVEVLEVGGATTGHAGVVGGPGTTENIAVLYVLISMCNQTASLTPQVGSRRL
jgi:hypothetical protein